MANPLTDIIVSVWNRPVETRNCLVHLAEHSPEARLIIVDNGSDRETERMLEEFADQLDLRAVLIRNDVNQGYVRAVNRGLERSEAGLIAIVRNTSIVTPSWLSPLSDLAGKRDDAGIMVPRLMRISQQKKGDRVQHGSAPIETDCGSLDAMIISRRAFEKVGGIDVEMDGGVWALRDLSRRCLRAGLFTFRVDDSLVSFQEDTPLGSVERRNLALQRSVSLYTSRWGERMSFCIHIPKGTDLEFLGKRLQVLHQGARQGHLFTILTHAKLYKELTGEGMDRLHEGIRFIRLPVIFESRSISSAMEREDSYIDTVHAVAGVEGIPFPDGIDALPFSHLEKMVEKSGREIYGGV